MIGYFLVLVWTFNILNCLGASITVGYPTVAYVEEIKRSREAETEKSRIRDGRFNLENWFRDQIELIWFYLTGLLRLIVPPMIHLIIILHFGFDFFNILPALIEGWLGKIP